MNGYRRKKAFEIGIWYGFTGENPSHRASPSRSGILDLNITPRQSIEEISPGDHANHALVVVHDRNAVNLMLQDDMRVILICTR